MSLSAETVMYNYKKKIEFFNKNINLIRRAIDEILSKIKAIDVSNLISKDIDDLVKLLSDLEKDINENKLIKKVLEMDHVDLENAKRVNNFLNAKSREIIEIKQRALLVEEDILKKEMTARLNAFYEININNLDDIKDSILKQFENNEQKTKINIFFKKNITRLQSMNEKNIKLEVSNIIKDHFENNEILKDNLVSNFKNQIKDNMFVKESLESEIKKFENHKLKNAEEVNKAASELQSKIFNQQMNEEVRKESIKAIVGNIQKRGFIVESDQIRMIDKNGEKIVRIYSEKPSGELARFDVYIDGRFKYEFGGYEGHAHDKDNDAFINDLSMYDISLSQEMKKEYDNPDREMSQAKKYQSQKVDKK